MCTNEKYVYSTEEGIRGGTGVPIHKSNKPTLELQGSISSRANISTLERHETSSRFLSVPAKMFLDFFCYSICSMLKVTFCAYTFFLMVNLTRKNKRRITEANRCTRNLQVFYKSFKSEKYKRSNVRVR